MNFKDLLTLSDSGKKYWEKLDKNIQQGYKYPFVLKIDNLLSSLNDPQIQIIKNNYKHIKDVDKLLDKLTEILIANIYIDEKPKFFNDNSGRPDIFLESTHKYIEIKRINNSDKQKNICDYCDYLEKNIFFESTEKYSLEQTKQNKKSVFKKIDDHIEKALKQLKEEKGIIYIIYSVDIVGISITEQEFINYIKQLSNSQLPKNISIEIMNINKLFY